MILVNKKVGETPLEVIKRINKTQEKMSYAGRLDPMASGLMILLEKGELNQKTQQSYQKLNKTYKVDVLFGISTDTYDALGLVTKTSFNYYLTKDKINSACRQFPKKFYQSYPPFSSKPVLKKPLWWWAKNKKLSNITIPRKKVSLKKLKYNDLKQRPLKTVVTSIIQNILKVNQDFRQEKIINKWNQTIKMNQKTKVTIASLEITCSSGTYMRSIANNLGKSLNLPAFALKIHRTKIGNYQLSGC